jgi:hypothetical protein
MWPELFAVFVSKFSAFKHALNIRIFSIFISSTLYNGSRHSADLSQCAACVKVRMQWLQI